MKFGCLALICIAAVPVLACPNLEGHWRCTYTNNQPDQEISLVQQDIPNGALYTLKTAGGNTFLFYADSVYRSFTDRQGYTTSTSYTCHGDTGFTEVQTMKADDPDFSGDATGSYLLVNSKTLNGEHTTALHSRGEPDHTETASFSCLRK